MDPDELLRLRLQLLHARGVIRQVDVKNGLAQVQAEFLGKELRRVDLPQGFGFGSAPLPGGEVFAVFGSGDRSAGVGVAYDDRAKRPRDLKPGEVILYGMHALETPNGHSIRFTDDPKAGTIKYRAARHEFRAGQFYILLDSDPAIGAQKGTWDPAQELPENPHGAAL
jgi:phage gp45-like